MRERLSGRLSLGDQEKEMRSLLVA